MEQQRRKEDGMGYKIKYLGGMAGALFAIGIILIAWGNTQWERKESARACEQRLDMRITTTEKDMVEVKTDIKYIRQGIDDLKARVK